MVELGGNDALRALPVEEMESNLDEIVARLGGGARGDARRDVRAAQSRRRVLQVVRGGLPRVADRHDVPLYTFFLDRVAGQPALNQPDGIHPTAEGISQIV